MMIVFLCLLWTAVPFVHAAPFPATSSSVLVDPAKGVPFARLGFRLNQWDPNWRIHLAQGEADPNGIRLQTSASKTGAVSIRMESLGESESIDRFAKKWLREYRSFGFDVLGSKPLRLLGGPALLVDLFERGKNRQLRQVILQKQNRLAIITCIDERPRFTETLQSCNRMVRGFEWSAGN